MKCRPIDFLEETQQTKSFLCWIINMFGYFVASPPSKQSWRVSHTSLYTKNFLCRGFASGYISIVIAKILEDKRKNNFLCRRFVPKYTSIISAHISDVNANNFSLPPLHASTHKHCNCPYFRRKNEKSLFDCLSRRITIAEILLWFYF